MRTLLRSLNFLSQTRLKPTTRSISPSKSFYANSHIPQDKIMSHVVELVRWYMDSCMSAALWTHPQ